MNFKHFYVAVVLTCFAIGFQSNLVGQDGPRKKNDGYWTTMKKSYTTVRNKYREMKKLQQIEIARTQRTWDKRLVDDATISYETIRKEKSKTAREYSIKNQLARALKSKIKAYISNKAKTTFANYKAKLNAKAKSTPVKRKVSTAKPKSASSWSTMKQSYTTVHRKYQAMKRLQRIKSNAAEQQVTTINPRLQNRDLAYGEYMAQRASKEKSKAYRKYSVTNQIAGKLKSKIKTYISNKAKASFANYRRPTQTSYKPKPKPKTRRKPKKPFWKPGKK